MAVIEIQGLSKSYVVYQKKEGLWASLVGLFRRQYRTIEAVRAIDLRVDEGEFVAFLGPNGAGKTTTLKLLSGVITPTAGTARVLGHLPWKRENAYRRRFALVMGQKNQLWWDLPAAESFRLHQQIYRIEPARFERTRDELTAMLGVRHLLGQPVRELSLGERMKCEMVAALLHRPAVLFLDEPTLGLDVSIQRRLRRFIAEYNRRSGATVILTSHYMADVAELCPRVILIHHGVLLYDGPLGGLVERLAPFKLIRLTLDGARDEALPDGLEVIEQENGRLVLRAARRDTPALTARLLSTLPVIDLAVEDPPVDAVIDQVYQEGSV